MNQNQDDKVRAQDLFNYSVPLVHQDYPNNMNYEVVTEVKLTPQENFKDDKED